MAPKKKILKKKKPIRTLSFGLIFLFAIFVIVIGVFATNPALFGKASLTSIKAGAAKTKECKFVPRQHLYAPILMYHHIGYSKYRNAYYVTPEIFDQQMKWLRENNYNVIPMKQFHEAISCGWDLPENPTVLTFDDGDLDQYDNAVSILEKYGFDGTFYIVTRWLGDKYHMTWDMVKNLSNAGFTIGGHTRLHPNVAHLGENSLKIELLDSKTEIEGETGKTVEFFAYPGGAHSKNAENHVRDYGYLNAVTTEHRVYHDINKEDDFYTLGRIHIGDEMSSFIDLMHGVGL